MIRDVIGSLKNVIYKLEELPVDERFDAYIFKANTLLKDLLLLHEPKPLENPNGYVECVVCNSGNGNEDELAYD